jgi:hypothetical protein
MALIVNELSRDNPSCRLIWRRPLYFLGYGDRIGNS